MRLSLPRIVIWPMPAFFEAAQRVADDGESLGRNLVGGNEIIRPLEIARIDIALVDELDEIDGVFGLELDLVEFLGRQNDMLSRLELEAADDVLLLDGALPRHGLEIANALSGLLVDLMQLKARSGGRRRMKLDADGDKREPEMAFPIGAHG